MGIDFSHCEASWAYSGFHRFRTRLAAQVGLLRFDEIQDTNDKRFEIIKNDPIRFLLQHSDCDGDIPPNECKQLAPRLKEMIQSWPDDYDKKQGLELVTGLELAAKKKQKLKFQ